MRLRAEVHPPAGDRRRALRRFAQRVARQQLELVRRGQHEHVAVVGDAIEPVAGTDRRGRELAGETFLPEHLAGRGPQAGGDAAFAAQKDEVALDQRRGQVRHRLLEPPDFLAACRSPSPGRTATRCFCAVTKPHVPRIRSPAITGEAMARSCFFGSKTDISQCTLPVFGSTAVMPCCQLVKIELRRPALRLVDARRRVGRVLRLARQLPAHLAGRRIEGDQRAAVVLVVGER